MCALKSITFIGTNPSRCFSERNDSDMPATQHYFGFDLDGWRSRSPVPVCQSPRLHLHPPRHKGLPRIGTTRKVKISIRANFKIKTTALTAAAANPAPSCSTQRRQQQCPFYTIQASCPGSWWPGIDSDGVGVFEFSDHAGATVFGHDKYKPRPWRLAPPPTCGWHELGIWWLQSCACARRPGCAVARITPTSVGLRPGLHPDHGSGAPRARPGGYRQRVRSAAL